MEITKVACKECMGTGYKRTWKNIDLNDKAPTFEAEEIACSKCNGLGQIDQPVFTVEEANAILKFCGLKG